MYKSTNINNNTDPLFKRDEGEVVVCRLTKRNRVQTKEFEIRFSTEVGYGEACLSAIVSPALVNDQGLLKVDSWNMRAFGVGRNEEGHLRIQLILKNFNVNAIRYLFHQGLRAINLNSGSCKEFVYNYY